MTWIVFIAYLVFFSWLVTVIPFFRNSGLPRKRICLLFLAKIIAGIAYFRFYSLPANKAGSDTWKFFNRSIPETNHLLSDPLAFIKELFVSRYGSSGGLFADHHSYWNDVKDELVVKLVAITNVFTDNNYYANIVWFNFLFLFGIVAFFRLLYEIYQCNKMALAAAVFLAPSFLFWCSGIHKDGLIFSMLGLIFYSFHRLRYGKKIWRYSAAIIIALPVIFLLRSYIPLLLVPCLAAGYFIHLFPRRRLLVTFAVFALGATFILTGRYLHPSLDIPKFIAGKQAQFKKLQGTSVIPAATLDSTSRGLIIALPSAIDVGFTRPHIIEPGLTSGIASFEIILVWCIFLYCLVKRREKNHYPPVVIACWLFVFATLLVIGYTVPFSGAVVRYRAILLPLILGPAIAIYTRNHIIEKYI